MSTVSVVAPTAAPSVLWRLTRIEAVRYAKHPLFLIGFALALASSGTSGPAELDHQVVPAFFLGVLGIIVANRLVTASDQPAAVVDAAPVPETVRTGALCLACLVPGQPAWWSCCSTVSWSCSIRPRPTSMPGTTRPLGS
jgi:hypothetical protein